jgi:hypothetical protein
MAERQWWEPGFEVDLCPWAADVVGNYGASRFGRHPDDRRRIRAAVVDLLGRSLRVPLDADPAAVVCGYHDSSMH